MKVHKILSLIESHAPLGAAEPWDNVGLLLGDPDWNTGGVVLSIDLTPKAIQTAAAKGYHLILTHHPALFPKKGGLPRLVSSLPESLSTLLLQAAQKKIAIASCHTNFDKCALEVIDKISKLLGITPLGRLLDFSSESLLKLVVFVPSTHLDAVRDSLCKAGAGQIGRYDSCTFSTPGVGTFRGGALTKPFIGKRGELEKVQEHRLETILPRSLQKPVLKALFESHPYEEVAFDFYPIESDFLRKNTSQGIHKGLGYGFWGDFSQAKSFSEVLRGVRSQFETNGFRVTDPPPSRVKRVAFSAGQGAGFVKAATQAGCDLFITGEVGYHHALDGKRQGMGVLELGHRESERFFLSVSQNWLTQGGVKSVIVNPSLQTIC